MGYGRATWSLGISVPQTMNLKKGSRFSLIAAELEPNNIPCVVDNDVNIKNQFSEMELHVCKIQKHPQMRFSLAWAFWA